MELKLEARIKRENEISAFIFHSNPFSCGLGSPWEKRMKGWAIKLAAAGWKSRDGRGNKAGTEGAAGHVENSSDMLGETHFLFSVEDATSKTSWGDLKDPLTLSYPKNFLSEQVV